MSADLDGPQAAELLDLSLQRAALAHACGHAIGDGELIERLGYRFYPMPGAELPSFLNKRFAAGLRTAAITLMAGLDLDGERDALGGCRTSGDAVRELTRRPGTIWLVRLALGNATLAWSELTSVLYGDDRTAFAALAAELLELRLCARQGCPLCAAESRAAA